MEKYFFYTEKMCVGYDGKPLVSEIEIALPKGEILCLIGPNGAGKSTVLKSIAGQLSLVGGAVYLGKESLAEMSRGERARKLSVVFTEQIKAEMMSCSEVAAMGRYPYTGRFGILSEENLRIVREAMKLVYVDSIGGQEFGKISDGQRQRVMLARAICQEPELVLLDEPTSYLDVRHKLEFLSILQEMRKKQNLTVILSLHELELAKRISDKILCLKGAYVEKYGTPEEIFQNGFIEKLFGITAGSFDAGSGGIELEKPKGKPEVFVIAGEGSGREVFHRLQRQGQAFAAGVLYDNDLDYPAAKALAAEVVAVKAFEPVGRETLEEAKKLLDSCSRAICSRKRIGSLDWVNRELLAYAKEKGKV